MHARLSPGKSLSVAGPGVGIELLAVGLVKDAAVVLARAAPGDELDVDAALRAGVGAQAAAFHRDLFERAQAHRNRAVPDGAAAFPPVRSVVDSVDRDVHRAAGAAGARAYADHAHASRSGSGRSGAGRHAAPVVLDGEPDLAAVRFQAHQHLGCGGVACHVAERFLRDSEPDLLRSWGIWGGGRGGKLFRENH